MTTPTLTRTANSGGPQLYWMGDGTEQFEIERDQLVTDIEGEHLCRLIGVSDPFQYTSREWGEKTGIRLLFEVVQGDRQGDQFSLMFGYSVGKKARLTPVVEALRRAPIGDGDEVSLGSLLGELVYLFVTINTTTKDGTTYQNTTCSGARVYAPKPKAPAAKPAQARKPAPAPAGDDPYEGLEDDE
jgi:hypothetical protein